MMPFTWGVYESTHRIIDSLERLSDAVLGSDRYMVLAREITKTFETANCRHCGMRFWAYTGAGS